MDGVRPAILGKGSSYTGHFEKGIPHFLMAVHCKFVNSLHCFLSNPRMSIKQAWKLGINVSCSSCCFCTPCESDGQIGRFAIAIDNTLHSTQCLSIIQEKCFSQFLTDHDQSLISCVAIIKTKQLKIVSLTQMFLTVACNTYYTRENNAKIK